ncbi:MAG TPA: hypothetical protein PLQ00_10145, partial [Thermoguttaceae bacterium]|nr:hypothetical protein [Thermoguttaceae bacterium]
EPFRQVRQKVNKGHWLQAAEQLQQLTETYPELPGLWWHLAVQRSWILDTSGAIDALRRYAALTASKEEAVLAEAAALALSADPLGDMIVSYKITYTPEDESDLQAALSLSKQIVPYSGEVPFLWRQEEGDVPPRSWYLLLERPVPEQDEQCTEQSLPSVMSYAALFGRQTDRQARLEVYGVHERNRPQVESLLNQFVGQGLRPDPLVEPLGEVSATQVSFGWGAFSSNAAGPKPTPEQEKEIRQNRFAQRWLDQPLGIFQGRSPRQAAQDPQCNTALEAVLLWVEHLAVRIHYPLERQWLRRQLGLPTPESVDLQTTPLRSVPLYRWAEMDLSKASDEDISEGYLYASYFRWMPAIVPLAEAFLGRPNLAKNPMWLSACYSAAVSAIPSDQAGGLIQQGRQRALEMNRSCAPWDLLEITYHLERREPQELDGLLRHIIQQHQYEPGVLESLIEILEPFGFLSPPQAAQAGPDGPAGESDSGLWTPGGEEKPASPKKLWTPDAP